MGSGHTRAANAVRDALLDGRFAARAVVADFLDDGDAASRFVKDTYLKMLEVFPAAYDQLYRWSQGPLPGAGLSDLTALVMRRKLLAMVAEHRPDIAVFTHPFPCCAAASLRRGRRMSLPLAAVLTDFAVHRLWVHREVDMYFVASQEMKAALTALGIPAERVHATGIPIVAGFAGQNRRRSDGQPSVLIMGGGLGLGAVEEALAALAAAGRRLDITVAAGGNDALRQRLAATAAASPHRITVVGFTDRIHELMAAASLLITKPGALTCSEALAVGIPLLLYSPLPGQEEDNAAYLVRRGAAVRAADAASLGRIAARLLAQPARLEELRARAAAVGRPHAAADAAAVIGGGLLARRVSPAG